MIFFRPLIALPKPMFLRLDAILRRIYKIIISSREDKADYSDIDSFISNQSSCRFLLIFG